MSLPPKIANFLRRPDVRTWIRRGLLGGTVLLIIIFGYQILSGLGSVPKNVRMDLLNAQKSHMKHNHQKALDQLKPFDRFKKYPNTAVFERASKLKNRVKTVLKRQDKIRDQYKNAMKHKVPDPKQTNPSVAGKELTLLETKLDKLRETHKEFLTQHEETATPYSETTGSMLELLLHRLVRVENTSDASYVRLYRYKHRIYSTYIKASRQKEKNAGDKPYKNILAYVNSTTELVKNTVFQPEAKQILINLRKKIADHFERIDQDVQKALQENEYDKAIEILNKQKSYFKDVSPWHQIIEDRSNTVSRLREASGS